MKTKIYFLGLVLLIMGQVFCLAALVSTNNLKNSSPLLGVIILAYALGVWSQKT